jgi:hypothetical protein
MAMWITGEERKVYYLFRWNALGYSWRSADHYVYLPRGRVRLQSRMIREFRVLADAAMILQEQRNFKE